MFGLFKKNPAPDPEFRFADAPNTACIACTHVVREGKPILHVAHDHDGGWQFLCGGEHDEADALVIALREAVALDPSVNALYEMPEGVGAERDAPQGKWVPFRMEEE